MGGVTADGSSPEGAASPHCRALLSREGHESSKQPARSCILLSQEKGLAQRKSRRAAGMAPAQSRLVAQTHGGILLISSPLTAGRHMQETGSTAETPLHFKLVFPYILLGFSIQTSHTTSHAAANPHVTSWEVAPVPIPQIARGGEARCPRCVSEPVAERMEPRIPVSTCVPHSGLSKEKDRQEGQRVGQFHQHPTHPSFVFEGREEDLTQWGALYGFSKLQLSPTARPCGFIYYSALLAEPCNVTTQPLAPYLCTETLTPSKRH